MDQTDRSESGELSDTKRALLRKLLKRAPGANAIGRSSRPGGWPLSPAQYRLWVAQELAPDSAMYNMPGGVRLRGRLDRGALDRSLRAVVGRHEALRTRFSTDAKGNVAQDIVEDDFFTLEVHDLAREGSELAEQELHARINRDAARPFVLSSGRLVRATLYRLREDDHVFVLNAHHIASDGWSVGLILNDFMEVYCATVQRREPSLAPLRLRYVDFAEWQASHPSAPAASTLAYWRKKLGGALPYLEVPADMPRPAAQSFSGGMVPFALSGDLRDQLRKLADQEGASLFVVLLAAFTVLLHRYSGQEDLIVGTPVQGRDRPELERLVGFFVDTLAVRTSLDGNPSFREVLRRVRTTVMEAFEHQELPFDRLVDELNMARTVSRTPVFQAMFVLLNVALPPLDLPELRASRFDVHTNTSKFDLWMALTDDRDGMQGYLEYNTDLFLRDRIERMARHFEVLLRSIVDGADGRIGELELLPDDERALVTRGWNQTDRDLGPRRLLHEVTQEQAERTPGKMAVKDERESYTYRELDAQANRLANHLLKRGAGPRRLVAILMDRSAEMVVALLATLKSGAAYLPIDPAWPAESIEDLVRDACPALVLTQARHREKVPTAQTSKVMVDDRGEWSSESTTAPSSDLRDTDPAYVIYTSGSTGRPKGAINTHRAIVNRLRWMQEELRLGEDDRVLQKTPYTFDVSVWELFLPLLAGAGLVMARPEGHKDPAYLASTIEREGITVVHFVPPMLRTFLEHSGAARCKGLRFIICSGEALSVALQDAAVATLPEAGLYNLYGPTEAAVDVTCWQCVPKTGQTTVPLGRPIANLQIYVLDKSGHPAPIGIPGELCIGGVGVGAGYLNRPELTAERFVPDLFRPELGTRLYRTGDLARFASDGTIEFLGRTDHQVKVRGVRIETGEIEHHLRLHPGVRDACVTAAEIGNGGHKQLVAYLVPDLRASDPDALSCAAEEHVEEWRSVFDATYEEGARPSEGGFDWAGWNSALTQEAIPEAEMREWLSAIVQVIRGGPVDRVLEIGVGNGLLLLAMARHCKTYWGTDISQAGLDHVARKIAGLGRDKEQVRLFCLPGHRIAELPEATFDTVILNSVVQYFPGPEYFLDVVRSCLERVADGGRLVLGDLRNLDLLEGYHAALQILRAGAEATTSEVLGRAEWAVRAEDELCVSPRFVSLLRREFPRIRGVDVLLKRGAATNELTAFRYDMVLFVGGEESNAGTGARTVVEAPASDDRFEAMLEELGPKELLVQRVLNARLTGYSAALAMLRSERPDAPVGPVQGALRKAHGSDPEVWCGIAERLGYRVKATYSGTDGPDRFDLLVYPASTSGADQRRAFTAPRTDALVRGECTTFPLLDRLTRQLVADLPAFLRKRLSEYMLPSVYVVLGELPLSANGKVDRRALPAPRIVEPDVGTRIAPVGPVETTLAEIWNGVLGTRSVGVTDNFFGLGGDSIKAIQVVSRANDAGLSLATRDLFQHQTVRALSEAIARRAQAQVPGGGQGGGAWTWSARSSAHGPPSLVRTLTQSGGVLPAAIRRDLDSWWGSVPGVGQASANMAWLGEQECSPEKFEAVLAARGDELRRSINAGGVAAAALVQVAGEATSSLVVCIEASFCERFVPDVEWQRLRHVMVTANRHHAAGGTATLSNFLPPVPLAETEVADGAGQIASPSPADTSSQQLGGSALALVAVLSALGDDGVDRAIDIEWMTRRAGQPTDGEAVPLRTGLRTGSGQGSSEAVRLSEAVRVLQELKSLSRLQVGDRQRVIDPGREHLRPRMLLRMGHAADLHGKGPSAADGIAYPEVVEVEQSEAGLRFVVRRPVADHAELLRASELATRYCALARDNELCALLTTLVRYPWAALSAEDAQALAPRTPPPANAYPLSALQRHMVGVMRSRPISGLYVVQRIDDLRGPVDFGAMDRAWRSVIARHELLRTSIEMLPSGSAVQLVSSEVHLEFGRQDWSEAGSDAIAERLERFLIADRERGFELGEPTPIRLMLIRTGQDTHKAVLTAHYTRVDGWSYSLIIADWIEQYVSEIEGRRPKLAPTTPYSTYLTWMANQDRRTTARYWQEAFDGFLGPTLLADLVASPGGSGRSGGSGRYRCIDRKLPANVGDAAQALAARHAVTLGVIAKAAWTLVLAHLTKSRDIAFGVLSAGRPSIVPGIERMVGPFLNVLPQRGQITPALPVIEWFHQLRDQHLATELHGYASLGEVVEWSRLPARCAPFDSYLAVQNLPAFIAERTGLEDSWHPNNLDFLAQMEHPLRIDVFPVDRIAIKFSFSDAVLPADRVEEWLELFVRAIEGLLESGERSVGELLSALGRSEPKRA